MVDVSDASVHLALATCLTGDDAAYPANPAFGAGTGYGGGIAVYPGGPIHQIGFLAGTGAPGCHLRKLQHLHGAFRVRRSVSQDTAQRRSHHQAAAGGHSFPSGIHERRDEMECLYAPAW